MAHRGRQTHLISAVPSRAALACFSQKLLLLGCATSLVLAVLRQARQKSRVCSAGPQQSCLGILLLSPFPQGRAPGKASRVVSGVPLHCCTAGSSEKRWQIPESLGAALTVLSHPLLQDVLQNRNPFTTHCFAEGDEWIFTRPLSWYSVFITSLVLSVGQAGGGGTWE